MLIEGLLCFSYASDMNLCSGCNTVFRGVVLICVLQNMALATPAHLSPACLSLAAQSFPKCLSFICSLSPTYLPLVTPCPLLVSPLVSRLSPPTCLPLVFCFPPLFSACFPACLPLLSLVCRRFVSPLSSTRQVRRICLGKIGTKDYRTCARGPNSLRPYIGLHWQSHLCTAYGCKPSAIFSGTVNFMALPSFTGMLR